MAQNEGLNHLDINFIFKLLGIAPKTYFHHDSVPLRYGWRGVGVNWVTRVPFRDAR